MNQNPLAETSEVLDGTEIEIDPDHEAAARAYIEAILRQAQVETKLSPELEAAERRRLWGRFATRYAEVTTPPLPKRGNDALRSALLNI